VHGHEGIDFEVSPLTPFTHKPGDSDRHPTSSTSSDMTQTLGWGCSGSFPFKEDRLRTVEQNVKRLMSTHSRKGHTLGPKLRATVGGDKPPRIDNEYRWRWAWLGSTTLHRGHRTEAPSTLMCCGPLAR
jgi:hypothetical protein